MSRILQVDLDAVQHNLVALRRSAPDTVAMAVVKADGYGHGAPEVAGAAIEAGAEFLGVADITEAFALRDAGLTAPIVAWLHTDTRHFAEAVTQSVTLGVSTIEQIEGAASAAEKAGAPAVIHLKVDTGLRRNGFDNDHLADAFSRARRWESRGRLRVEGIFSHLANTSENADRAALDRFLRIVELAQSVGLEPHIRHLAATAAGLARPDTHLDMVRWGIGLYGIAPDDRDPRQYDLRPALSMRTRVAATRRVFAGDGISYDYAYITDRDTTVALIPVGYADGIPRLASPGAWVSIDGMQCPVRGRIAMDQMVVECPSSVNPGDSVIIIGDPNEGAPTASQWAQWASTIGYEMVARLPRPGGRVDRAAVEPTGWVSHSAV
ncbi:alanine racemase [Rhodococcus koreensis]